MKRTILIVVFGILVVALAISARRAGAAPSPQAEIKIDNFSFTPLSLTVPAGTVVTWINHDDIPHTVVSDDRATFKSHALDTDDKFTFKFDRPGTYSYFCSIHPKMTAKVMVLEP